MTRSTLAALALSSTLLATAGLAAAQPAYVAPEAAAPVPAPAAEHRHHSINVSPLGLIGGGINANYEYLSGHNGLLLELGGSTWMSDNSSSTNGQMTSSSEIDARHGTVGIGYRYHFRGRQNSLFLGAMLHHSQGTADVKWTANGQPMEAKDIEYQSTTLTANIGKRWMLTRGLNLTARIGIGTADREVTDESADAAAVAKLEDTLSVPVAVDGELSLGWSF